MNYNPCIALGQYLAQGLPTPAQPNVQGRPSQPSLGGARGCAHAAVTAAPATARLTAAPWSTRWAPITVGANRARFWVLGLTEGH
jgi:hypothetical protein